MDTRRYEALVYHLVRDPRITSVISFLSEWAGIGRSTSTHLLWDVINLHRDLHFNRQMIRSTVPCAPVRLPRDLHRPYLHIGTRGYCCAF